MNEVIFVALYATIAILGLLSFIILPVLSLWIALAFVELVLSIIPVAGESLAKVPHLLRHLLEKWVILWPLKKLAALGGKGAEKTLEAAWRGFIIVLKRLLAAAGRGMRTVFAALWSRLRAILARQPTADASEASTTEKEGEEATPQ